MYGPKALNTDVAFAFIFEIKSVGNENINFFFIASVLALAKQTLSKFLTLS